MSQTLNELLVHIVFSTKDRIQMIHPKIEQDLYHYIIGLCRDLKCPVMQINGVSDHIHILIRLHPMIALSELIQKIKANSSRWIKSQNIHYKSFTWQTGYGAFSVSKGAQDNVMEYIKMQKKHHEQISFKDELIAILKLAKIEYDEKYL